MTIAESLLPEFDHEMATTRRLLERVPEDRFGWRPHEKSMTLGRLASHLAEMPDWGYEVCTGDEIDLAPQGAEPQKPAVHTARAELLAAFDAAVAKAREAIARTDDATMMRDWSAKGGDQTYFTMPKVAVLRAWVLNHNVHHRGQLSVYLRLLDVPVPAIYGPSADERGG
jgi:uncharacterized damage-inducible protein DinB